MLTVALTTLLAAQSLDFVASPYWMHTESLAASGCVESSTAAAATCALFAAGESNHAERKIAIVTASGAGTCCWVSNGTTHAATTLGTVWGLGSSGPGACFRLEAGGQLEVMRPNRKRLLAHRAQGVHVGLCSTPATVGGESLYAGCTLDAHCSSFGGGTCTAAPSQQQIDEAGVMLECIPSTGTIAFTARKEYRERMR